MGRWRLADPAAAQFMICTQSQAPAQQFTSIRDAELDGADAKYIETVKKVDRNQGGHSPASSNANSTIILPAEMIDKYLTGETGKN